MKKTQSIEYRENFTLSPADNRRLASLCGQFDDHIKQIEHHLNVDIHHHANTFYITGDEDAVKKAGRVLQQLYQDTQDKKYLDSEAVHLALRTPYAEGPAAHPSRHQLTIKTPYLQIKPRSATQYHYIKKIQSNDINFSIGPAGTGKTYLAVACAVAALEKDQVRRIILVRPAVEAGESLGFLPGDLAQKVNPYLQPLYDALYEMLGIEHVNKLIDRNVIEIAPLAYMRGRTLNDAFIILDESQNTTKEQMQMFLTRLGFGSKSVITGDITQIDLPKHVQSGLIHAIDVLDGVAGISFTTFDSHDVVRHPLVQRIVEAYHRKAK